MIYVFPMTILKFSRGGPRVNHLSESHGRTDLRNVAGYVDPVVVAGTACAQELLRGGPLNNHFVGPLGPVGKRSFVLLQIGAVGVLDPGVGMVIGGAVYDGRGGPHEQPHTC